METALVSLTAERARTLRRETAVFSEGEGQLLLLETTCSHRRNHVATSTGTRSTCVARLLLLQGEKTERKEGTTLLLPTATAVAAAKAVSASKAAPRGQETEEEEERGDGRQEPEGETAAALTTLQRLLEVAVVKEDKAEIPTPTPATPLLDIDGVEVVVVEDAEKKKTVLLFEARSTAGRREAEEEEQEDRLEQGGTATAAPIAAEWKAEGIRRRGRVVSRSSREA